MHHSITSIIATLAQKLLPACYNLQTAEQESWWLLEKVTQKKQSNVAYCPNFGINTPPTHNA